MKKNLFFVIALTLVVLTGCSKFVPGGGTVTFEDGSPVTGGAIVFETDNFMSDGQIKPDGRYVLSSLAANDGLPPGKYKVAVSWTTVDDKDRVIYLIDPKFSNPETSMMTAEVVRGGKNKFDFVVRKPSK